jgi:ELWxxDGT repeat protein
MLGAPLLLLLIAAAAEAESPYLVKDLLPGSDESAAVAPRGLVTVGGRVFFYGEINDATTAAPTAAGIWVSDGTASGTQPLAILCPRGCGIRYLGNVGPLLYFVADLGFGSTLWRSDGTRGGSFQLSPSSVLLDASDGSGYVGDLPHYALVGNVLYFVGCTGFPPTCDQLWRTDGSQAGTTLVADLTPPLAVDLGYFVGGLTASAGKLYFTGPLGSDGRPVLWRSDGTRAGTVPFLALDGDDPFLPTLAGGRVFLVASAPDPKGLTLWATDGSADPQPLTQITSATATVDAVWLKPLGNRVYLLANDGTHGQQIWVSDGTRAGTAALTGFSNRDPFADLGPDRIELVANRLLFIAADGTHPSTLWTSSGPQAMTPLCAGSCGHISSSTRLVKLGARVVFLTGDDQSGFALWASDGTAAGTTVLKQACVGTCNPFSLTVLGGEVFFPVDADHAHGSVLWQSDGTAAGTHPAAGGRIDSSLATLYPLDLAILGSRFLFTGPEGDGSSELWTTDGTAAGTRQLTDAAAPASSSPNGFVSLGNRVFFRAGFGRLWQSDGTAATTVEVPGVDAGAGPLVATAGSLFFFAGPDSLQLWRADGSATGTVQLTHLPSGQEPYLMAPFRGKLAFLVSGDPPSLWQSDGTPQGTVKLLDFPPLVPGTSIDSLTAVDGLLFAFMTADEPCCTYTLWRSDGTNAGTYQLAQVPYGGSSLQVTAAGGWLYFLGSNGGDVELWRTDGTLGGTAPVMSGSQLVTGEFAGSFAALTDLSGTLYFFIDTPGVGEALWRSDGTPGGTFPLLQFPYLDPNHPPTTAVVGNQLFFVVNDDLIQGRELWTSDGTAAGTHLVRAFNSVPVDSAGLLAAAGRVFFNADDGVHGPELWESDGTAAGTHLVQDVWPGPAGSDPSGMTQAGDLLFFAADDGLTGNELWALPLAGATSCRPLPTALCLLENRFKVEAFWRDFAGNSGPGQAVPLTPDTGTFWFFDPQSVEVVGKVIDGRTLDDHFWFFYGALSNVEYSLTVTDTATGAARRYLNPSGQLASVGDTTAFGPQGALAVGDPAATALTQAMAAPAGGTLPASGGHAGPGAASPDGSCQPAASTLCLDGGRFSVQVSWQDFSGRQGVGTAVGLSAQTGYFWFFNPANVELMLKVIDGRAVNGKFWVLFGALSNVAYTVTVQDTVSGKLRTYTNPAGQFASVADTAAF